MSKRSKTQGLGFTLQKGNNMIQVLTKISNIHHIWTTGLGLVIMAEINRAMTVQEATGMIESLGIIGVLLIVSWLLWKEKQSLTEKILQAKDKENDLLRQELKEKNDDVKKLLQLLIDSDKK